MSHVRHLRRASLVMFAMLAFPSASSAQEAPSTPAGWRWALDARATLSAGGKAIGADSLFELTDMAPGWHITMGPGAAIYDDRERAAGRFSVSGELILFPDASDAEYGVFIGGQGLEGATPQWIAFVVRRDGSAAVMQRVGEATRMLMPWTLHTAVKARPDGGSARNVLQVLAEPDSVRFVVNGERVTSLPRAGLVVDGPFGFRIGKGVNLHITNLDVTRRLAPYPRRR